MSTQPLTVLSIGASRNIGYYSSIRLLDAGATVTFLLRAPAAFDSDETIQKYVKSGKARLVKGDALVREDVQNAWNVASLDAKVDVLVFTLGGYPNFSLRRGVYMDPPNLVTQSLINVLSTMPKAPKPEDQTRIITITSIGMSRTSHASLPFLLKPFYGAVLKAPHVDKVGSERVIAHCAGWAWDEKEFEDPGPTILGENWEEGLPAGELKRVLVVRPALYTDGVCVADQPVKEGKKAKAPYRVSEEELGGYTISRKDVAHFIVDAILNKWDQYENKAVNISY